jgi:hypothetical protein
MKRDAAPPSDGERSQLAHYAPARDLNDRLVLDLIDAVKGMLRKESADRLRDVYLIGDIEKDIARNVIERLRERASSPTTVRVPSPSTSTAPAAT